MSCPLSQSPKSSSPQPRFSYGHWGLRVSRAKRVLLSEVLTGRREALTGGLPTVFFLWGHVCPWAGGKGGPGFGSMMGKSLFKNVYGGKAVIVAVIVLK